MSKVYITSKSKTFKEGSGMFNILDWVTDAVDHEMVEKTTDTHYEASVKTKQKYKITISRIN